MIEEIKDYAIEGSAIGNVGATRTFDLETANFFSATVDQASTFTFSNPFRNKINETWFSYRTYHCWWEIKNIVILII